MPTSKEAPAIERVSFKLEDFTAGGVVPEGDYLLKSHEVVFWDYDGKLPTGTLALRVTMQSLVGGKPEGDDVIQHYSIGNPEHFSPSEDGNSIVAISDRTTLGKGSNFFIWLENLTNAGFPEDKFDNEFQIFNGLAAHIVHIPEPKRSLPKGGVTGAGETTRERTIPVVSKILKYPWDAATKKKGGAKAAKPAAATATAATEEDATEEEGAPAEAGDLLLEHLAPILEDGKPVAKTRARVQVFKRMNDAKVDVGARDEALKIFNSDDALGVVLESFGYTVEGGKLVPGE